MDSSGCVEQLQIDYTVSLELHRLSVKAQEFADELEFRNEKNSNGAVFTEQSACAWLEKLYYYFIVIILNGQKFKVLRFKGTVRLWHNHHFFKIKSCLICVF